MTDQTDDQAEYLIIYPVPDRPDLRRLSVSWKVPLDVAARVAAILEAAKKAP